MFYSPITGFGSGMMIVIPAMLLAMWAQSNVKSTFKKYLKVRNNTGKTGFEAARTILDRNGLSDVKIERVAGSLSDHYDPRSRILRLSNDVYAGQSIASVSVAAHEAGQALQHANAYTPLQIRGAMFPAVNFASKAAWPLAIIGFLIIPPLIDIGILLFTIVVMFQLVTLPVELNASSRAIVEMENHGIIGSDENGAARKVLKAAALTYIAAAAVAVANLLRLIILRGSRD